MQRHEGGYYIGLAVVDRPGTAATIARRMADEKISLESIVQRGRDRRPHGGEDPQRVDQPALVVLITYATSEDAVRRALAAIEQDGVLAEKPKVIRIEKSCVERSAAGSCVQELRS
jgi:homoserine dehydrogenase